VSHAVRVITLEVPDTADPYALYFARQVALRSHGTLKVNIDFASYNDNNLAAEGRLVAALQAGRASFAFQPARGWAVAGVAGFQGLDAPFLVTTMQATEQIASGPLARVLLRQLTPLGVVGLGLIPNEPRQILSIRPLITPADFHRVPLRIINSLATAALIRAIGARPIQGMVSTMTARMLKAGSLVGVETSPRNILSNFYNEDASYLTAYGIFPKFDTIAASASAWRNLTGAEQAAMRQAAADTLAHADRTVTPLEQHELTYLCSNGLVLDEPSAAQLAALASEASSAAPAGAAADAMTRMIRAAIPGTGPQPVAVAPPPGCRVAGTAAEAIALHGLSVSSNPAGRAAAIPPGTYVTTDTVRDLQAGGVYGSDWNKAVTYTTHFYSNGTFLQTQQPDYPDQPFIRGRYVVKGDEVTFISRDLDDNPEVVRWSYYDGQLTFAIVNVEDIAGKVIYTAHPWTRVS
jgi:TRAP-type C4-dicarboxylate transport system substrate-binding protein